MQNAMRGAWRVGKDELSGRFDKISEGRWLLDSADRTSHCVPPTALQRTGCMREVSRARQCLTGPALVPGDEDTFRVLQDRRPQQVIISLRSQCTWTKPCVQSEECSEGIFAPSWWVHV